MRIARLLFALAVLLGALAPQAARGWESTPGETEAYHKLRLTDETEHTKWARPYAPGKPRVLFFVDSNGEGMNAHGREALEFLRRFDAEVETAFMINFYGNYWLGCNAGIERLNRLLERDWDVLVFQDLPPSKKSKYGNEASARQRMLELVAKGAGVVLLGTDDGGWLPDKKPLAQGPEFLKDLEGVSYFEAGPARVVQHGEIPFIPWGVGWEARYDRWQERLGRMILWAAKREPALRIQVAPASATFERAQLPADAGSVSWEGQAAGPLEIEVRLRRDDGRVEPLAKASAQASPGKLALKLPALREGGYAIEAFARGAKGIESWTVADIKVASADRVAAVEIDSGKRMEFKQITKDAAAQKKRDEELGVLLPYFEIGETLSGQVELTGSGAGKRVRINLRGPDERILLRQEAEAQARAPFSFKVEPWWPMVVRVEALLLDGEAEASAAYAYAHVTQRRQGGFHFVLWDFPVESSVAPYVAKALRKMGVTAITTSRGAPLCAAAHGLAWIPWTGGNVTSGHLAEWTEQPPEKVGAYMVGHTTRSRPSGVLAYSLGDEGKTSGYGTGPGAVKRWQEYLKQAYGSIEALNASWETQHPNFEALTLARPKPMPEAMGYDMAMFGIENFVGFAKAHRENLRKVDPGAAIGFEGSGGFEGDPELFCKDLDFWAPYAGGVEEVMRSFAPRSFLRGNWMGYHVTPEGHLGDYWRGLTLGHNSVWFWMWSTHGAWNGWQHPDLNGVPDEVEALLADTTCVREGLGDLLQQYRMQEDGIAILYSRPSNYAIDRLSKDQYIQKVEWAHYEWWTLVRDLGYQFRYVSDRMLERGEFKPGDAKILILPQAVALGEKEAQTVRAFVEAGGTVIADFYPGLYDTHTKRQARSPLEGLFGVKGGQPAALKAGKLQIETQFKDAKLALKDQDVEVDTTVSLADGQAWANVEGTPAFVVKPTGKGQAILFNFPVWKIVPSRSPPRGMGGVAGRETVSEPVGRFFAALFEALGLKRQIVCQPYKNKSGMPYIPNVEVVRWRDGEYELFSVFRNNSELAAKTMCSIVTPDRKCHVYDLREGVSAGNAGYWFHRIQPFRPTFYALLPQPLAAAVGRAVRDRPRARDPRQAARARPGRPRQARRETPRTAARRRVPGGVGSGRDRHRGTPGTRAPHRLQRSARRLDRGSHRRLRASDDRGDSTPGQVGCGAAGLANRGGRYEVLLLRKMRQAPYRRRDSVRPGPR
ncbi:MAG: beta-galactosidase trimerization domain-containing protein [Planctomycetota bacterium]|nr:beta-galactosidase trimerization domain-containing protein [Planctomycetota bacterium]